MAISREQLMNFFDSVYDKESAIKAQRDEINEDFDIYADDQDIGKKVLKEGYKIFKSYKTGKATPDDDDYYEIVAAIEARFAQEV